MRAKKLGRHELLSWVNTLTQSDYSKIENMSDGVAFCQIFDAFYPNIVNFNCLKLNSKNAEDWEKNFYLLNEILTKIKSFKQIDPSKMSKGKFTPNFEFLQFVYDLLAKNFGEPSIKYPAYDKRTEILKSQYGSRMNDVKKFLPTHLIPNELILKMDKQKFFGSSENLVEKENEKEQSHLNTMLDKYKDFFTILKDDLRKMMDKNVSLSGDARDIEEERLYYLEKINNVLLFCENKLNSTNLKPESFEMLDNIIKIIKHVPEDFK